jgi:hypothetical protein
MSKAKPLVLGMEKKRLSHLSHTYLSYVATDEDTKTDRRQEKSNPHIGVTWESHFEL